MKIKCNYRFSVAIKYVSLILSNILTHFYLEVTGFDALEIVFIETAETLDSKSVNYSLEKECNLFDRFTIKL